MMRSVPALASPFGDEHLTEIPLPNAPLVRVIAQVTFPEIASVVKREFVGGFQESIRADYPILREEQGLTLVVGPEGVTQQVGDRIWRFHSADGIWRTTLAPTFVALETDGYISRDDFFARFEKLVEATQDAINPAFWERLGVRYVDRLEDAEDLEQLQQLIKAEVLGLAAIQTGEGPLHTFIGQAQFSLDNDVQLLAKTGILPAKALLEPSIPPAETRSWTLDLDMSVTGQFEFDAAELHARGRELAAGVYRFFRWAVTTQFLRRFGASDEDLKKLEDEA
jgi:uncharacterized protein (TIGR04255 family)